MIEEHQLIPYQSSELPPGPWLVFAPHPDDDVLGMGGSIAMASSLGTRVEVVVMTGGEGAGEPVIRRREALEAGQIIGVRKYHFLDIPDRLVNEASIDSLKGTLEIIENLCPATVFLPGIQEYHPDHRATTRLVRGLLQDSNYQGQLWLYEISRHNEANRLLDITPVVEKKICAVKCFVSQLKQADYLEVVMGINMSRSYTLDSCVTHAEGFWTEPDSRIGLDGLGNRMQCYILS